ncbi:MAG: hypothetical protein GWO24_27700 [Akkermansiaceae bacterium]|nr:hypothetical protein [Akkermansiaceae bacterium]
MQSPFSNPDHANPAHWRASAAPDGSPGTSDREPLNSWLTAHNLAPGEELTDRDLDGLAAIMEYALGTNPDDPSHLGALTTPIQSITVDQHTADYLVLRFPRRNGADDVLLEAEFSVDLITWIKAGPVVSFSPTTDPAVEMVGIRAPLPLENGPQQFLRLRATSK